MDPLLLLIGVFLHLTRSTHSAESRVKVKVKSAGSDVKIACSLDSEEREWRWAPLYPRCVTTGSKEVVIYSPSGHPTEDAEDPFHGRLTVLQNEGQLKLQNLRVNDSGTFNCVGKDNKSRSINLSVSYDCNPAPTEGSDRLGQHMRLSCCENTPPVTWLLDGQTVQNSSGVRVFRKGVLTIPTLGPEHRGLWSCLDEDGRALVELCLEVTEEEQDPHVAAPPTSAPPGGRSTRGAEAKAIHARVVWGIAGVLAAVLFILLMIGVYCCLRKPKMRTAESKTFNGAMEDVKPAGRRHGEDEGEGENKAGSPQAQAPQGAAGHEEIHYSLLEFPMAEGRAEIPRAPENSPVYSEVSRKT